MESTIKSFDGNGDVKVFIEKVCIHSSLKGYENEKAAQNLAGRLEGRAFDVYMRLSDADKKEFSKIKAELLKEFERGNQDREVAIHELNNRNRKPVESAQTFAYKVQELVKLAYPLFDEDTRSTISKDYYIKGLHPNMQIALKSLPDFSSSSQLSTETTRLELAGIDSFVSSSCVSRMSVNAVNTDTLVDSITAKVVEKIKEFSLNLPEGEFPVSNVNYVDTRFNRGRMGTNRNQSRPRSNRGGYSRGYSRNTTQFRKCRVCQSPDPFVKECPSRYCQACGHKGHDAWSSTCPNYNQ